MDRIFLFVWHMHPLLVTAAIIFHQGKVLLARRKTDAPYPLFWEFPGGKVEPMEEPSACIVREIREELAIEVVVEGIYDVVYYRYPERPVLVLAYRCTWASGEIIDLDVAEHRWVLPESLPDFELLPADVPLAERIRRDFSDEGTAGL
jgi:8-oxo-dGTP diphosphatase